MEAYQRIFADLVRDGMRRAFRAAERIEERFKDEDIEVWPEPKDAGDWDWHPETIPQCGVKFRCAHSGAGVFREVEAPLNATSHRMFAILLPAAEAICREVQALSSKEPPPSPPLGRAATG
jgi:hypothetical protein